MSKIKVTEVLAFPNDVLQVTGTFGKRSISAFGWQSALTNHYPAEAYDENGDLKLKRGRKGAPGDPEHEPREMTKAEKLDYCRSLLQAVVDAEPKPLDISG